jgi:molybdopterin converting factor small subunit
MSPTVEIAVEWAPQAGGRRLVHVRGRTVGECLAALLSECPELGPRLAPGHHELFVNGQNARFTGGLLAPVAESDTLLVLPARG